MNTNFLNSVTNFLKKRTFELLGLILILTGIALAISFATYAPEDPSFIYGDSNIEIKNFFGIYGSSIADFLLQSFGLASFLLLANRLTSIPGSWFKAMALTKPDKPSPTMHIFCLFILKFLTIS